MFGAIFTWFMVFVSHLYFRKKWELEGGRKLPVKMLGFPYLTILGGALLLSLLISTWFTPFKNTLQFGIPWLLFLTIVYFVWGKKSHASTQLSPKNEDISKH